MATGMTIGDIAGFIQLAKSGVLGLEITDFGALFDKIEALLKSTGQWTDDLAEKLALAEEQLKANPALFDIGKQTFVDSIDALLAKYPPDTLLSDIPEFQGGPGPVEPDPEIPGPIELVEGSNGLNIALLEALRKDVTVEFDPVTKTISLHGMGVEVTLPDLDRVQFGDGTLAFDVDGISGRVFRLYQAVFGREPDTEGLGSVSYTHLDVYKRQAYLKPKIFFPISNVARRAASAKAGLPDRRRPATRLPNVQTAGPGSDAGFRPYRSRRPAHCWFPDGRSESPHPCSRSSRRRGYAHRGRSSILGCPGRQRNGSEVEEALSAEWRLPWWIILIVR